MKRIRVKILVSVILLIGFIITGFLFGIKSYTASMLMALYTFSMAYLAATLEE